MGFRMGLGDNIPGVCNFCSRLTYLFSCRSSDMKSFAPAASTAGDTRIFHGPEPEFPLVHSSVTTSNYLHQVSSGQRLAIALLNLHEKSRGVLNICFRSSKKRRVNIAPRTWSFTENLKETPNDRDLVLKEWLKIAQ